MQGLKKALRIIGGILCSIMVVVSIIGLVVANAGAVQFSQSITMFLGGSTSTVEGGDGTLYYQSDYASHDEEQDAAKKACYQIEAEGAVLLKNEDGALPLAAGDKVSLIGQDSVDFLYGGSGAGSVDASGAQTLRQSLESAGFEVNPVLWDFYETGAGKSFRKTVPDVTGKGGFDVNEVPLASYTDDVLSSMDEYNDAAIVTIGRTGSESTDLPIGYLQLTEEEKQEISCAAEHFDRVIVLLNTLNPMELGYLDEQGVDAVLWVGAGGEYGIDAIGNLLTGVVNPSGHLVDTYAYSAQSAPAMENFGDYTVANSTVDAGTKYLSYSEGIYVGYRYYETRYEDKVLGQGNAGDYDYAATVQYPFGYGLSYTTFAWSDPQMEDLGDTLRLTITVTNTGSVSGQDVVEAYLQQPYTDYDRAHAVEKASVVLAGFARTSDLKPQESEMVSVDIAKEQLKAYDADGAGTYILEPGTYYLALGTDAHAALDNILAAKGKTIADGMTQDGNAAMVETYEVAGELDATTYSTSQETQAPIRTRSRMLTSGPMMEASAISPALTGRGPGR